MKRALLSFIIFLFCYESSLFAEDYYSVRFEGIPCHDVQMAAESASQLISLQHRPPPSFFTLRYRAESDIPILIQVLHAYGYYDAHVNLEFKGDFPCTTVIINIQAGPLYTFAPPQVLAAYCDPECPGELKEELPDYSPFNCICLDGCGLIEDAPAYSQDIIDGEDYLLDQMRSFGYPLAKFIRREVIVDQEKKQVFVTYVVESGPIAYFGPVMVCGLTDVKKEFVEQRILWKEGDLYDPEKIKKTDQYIQESGLFSVVILDHDTQLNEDGLLPIYINVSELKHRHVGAGISYSTNEGFGGYFQWDHDNFRNIGEELAVTVQTSEILKKGSVFYGKPDYFGHNQDLIFLAEVIKEDYPGFTERALSFLTRVDRKVGEDLSLSYGLRYERMLSTKSDNDDNYDLISAPFSVVWNTSNRLFNPTAGIHIDYRATPYQNLFTSNIFFFKQELLSTVYTPIYPNEKVILALSAQFGTIVGQSRYNVPAPKRFYAGSASGLRGYAYMTVSPLKGDTPIGGRSLLIFQIEPRFQVFDQFYIVAFYEMGNVYAEALPSFKDGFLRSTGIGARYVTALGALRLDIAFPLDRRKGIDHFFQIYASIGQSF